MCLSQGVHKLEQVMNIHNREVVDVPSLEVLKPRLDGDPEQPGSRGVPAYGRDVGTG